MITLASSSLCNSPSSFIHSSITINRCLPNFITFPFLRKGNSVARRRLGIVAATEGSAKKKDEEKQEDPSVPTWAKPGTDEPPPWAKDEAQKDSSTFEIPFIVYLLASAVTAIAAIGSIFEYANQKPVFGVLGSDSVFYAPLLGFFAFTGIPTSSIEARAKKEPHATAQEEKTSKILSRAQWVRAGILGANDGLLSTTSLMLGVGAAKDQDQRSMVLSGIAGALAGACSMAVGEFVSVSTQLDIAKSIADELKGGDGGYETKFQVVCSSPTNIAETKQSQVPHDMTLNNIFATSTQGGKSLYESPVQIQSIFLTPARSPMTKVMETDARRNTMESSKVGNDTKPEPLPSPLKAAAASSLAFLCGAFVPVVPALLVSENRNRIGVMVIIASLALCLFGGIGAYLGGSSVKISAMRVLLGGWISMAITYGLLKPFDNDSKRDHDTT